MHASTREIREALSSRIMPIAAKKSLQRVLRGRGTRFDRWWFQPDLVMREAGMEPDLWQSEVLSCTRRNLLLNVSRQAGKSQVVAAFAILIALLEAPALVLILSRSLRQAGELFRAKLMPVWHKLQVGMRPTKETALQLELPNGSRILSLPGHEATIRCFSGAGLLIIDEASRTPDALFRAVRPMLAVSGGRTVALSTPWGKRGWFYQQSEADDDVWRRWKLPWTVCPRMPQSFIDEELKIHGQQWVDQEYNVKFENTPDTIFADQLIKEALDNSLDGIDL